MNPYRILKTDNGYEIVRVSYDEDGWPQNYMPVDFISAESFLELGRELGCMVGAMEIAKASRPLTYADFKREG